MDNYKILFIDEETESFDCFLDYVENSSKINEVSIITELPMQNLDLMIEKIIELNPDAIITDYYLNEKKIDIDYNIPYNGTDLVHEFLKIKDSFPCFVLTAFDDKAINEIEDVNKIYIKHILHKTKKKESDKARVSFLDRVIIQIQHYKSKLQKAEEELLELLEKKKQGNANYIDEDKIEKRIIELDSIIEKSIDKSSYIPKCYKTSSNADKLGDLLSKVDELINKFERAR